MPGAIAALSSRKVRVPKWSSLRDAVRTIFEADPIHRVGIVRAGVPAIFVVTMTKDMGLAKERFYVMTGLARATVDRKIARKDVLSQTESERVVGFAQLVGQVQSMVRESGTGEHFDGPKWIAAWLERAHPALGGRKPGDLIDTADGRGLVGNLLARQQSGAYA